jgi:hypothetical protein
MSFVPGPLTSLVGLLREQGVPVLGVLGDEDHTSGYHIGKDRIYKIPPGRGDDDYSIKTARDRAGLSNAAAAIDIGRFDGRLDDLGLFLVAESKAGRAPDIREVTFEGFDGSIIRRWDAHYGRHTTFHTSLSGLHHIHVGFYRDSEYRNKTDLFERFFLPDTGTGDPMRNFELLRGTDGLPIIGTVKVKSPDGVSTPHSYLRLSDGALRPADGLVGVTKAAVKIRLTDPITAGPQPEGVDRQSGFLIGDLAAFLLATDVSFTPDSRLAQIADLKADVATVKAIVRTAAEDVAEV